MNEQRPQPEEESDFWARRAKEQSEANRQQRVPRAAFSQHFTAAHLSQQKQQASQYVQSGLWRGLKLPPGSKFAPSKDQLINGSDDKK